MSFTDYLEDKILYKNFGNVTYNSQVNVWIGLSTTLGSDNGTTSWTEPSDGSYNKIEMDNRQTASGWSVPVVTTSGYEIHNNGAITFDEAVGGWGTITHFMVYEIVGSDSNMMAYGQLNAAKTIDGGDTAEFPSGNLVIKLF